MEEIRGPGYRIVLTSDIHPITWDPREGVIRAPRIVFELDARISAAGEALASLLIPPVEVESGWARELVDKYRTRLVAEQAADLAQRIGGVAGLARVEEPFFPLARAWISWRINGCLLHKALDPEELRPIYKPYMERVGVPVEGGVKLRPSRFRETIAAFTRELQALRVTILGLMARAARHLRPRPPWPGMDCEMPPPPDPSPHVILPEGVYVYECGGAEALAERVVGGAECRPASRTASSFICESPRGRVVVKEYLRMILKWLPAAVASTPYYGYKLSPKTRLYNEYKYLRILRGVVPTPRILAVCGTQANTFMVREYTEGEPVLSSEKSEAWRASGVSLGRIHKSGHVLGDPNPGNFVWKGDAAAVIDAEQAGKLSPRRAAWDLAVYTVYALLFRAREDLVAEGIRAYRREAPQVWAQAEEILSSRKFWTVFAATPNIAVRARRILLES